MTEAIYGKGIFDRIQGQTREIPRKPAPDGALRIAEKLKVLPEECMYFGDTNTDMQTGRAAGMFTVGVTWGFRSREELLAFHPVLLADHPAQVIDFVRRANGI